MGSTGNGGTPHLAGELFKMMAGVNMVHTPFRRPERSTIQVLVDERAQVMFSIPARRQSTTSGPASCARIAVTAARLETLPELPSVGDFVPGYQASTWNGVGAPANTPVDIVDQLNKAINAGLATYPGQGAPCRTWKRRPSWLSLGFWEIHCQRDGEMGKGHEIREPQGRLTRRNRRRDRSCHGSMSPALQSCASLQH